MWNMRYYKNSVNYQPGGPILLYLGGEWTITPGWLQTGHMHDLGVELNAMMYYTEHRFYGSSWPLSDTSVADLQYLSVDQALADLASFIKQMRASQPGLSNASVIVTGGSYSATMAVWMREKYPDLVAGAWAWASSAPILAKGNFVEYKETVGFALKTVGGQACYDRVEEAFSIMEDLFAARQPARIEQEFGTCKAFDLNNKLDIQSFVGDCSDWLSGVVQYHRAGDIEGFCSFILDPIYPDGMAAYGAWIRTQYGNYCFDNDYADVVEYYRNIDISHPANDGGRQWLYQTCSEYGWYQTSDSSDQPFGSSFPVEFYYQFCSDIFDDTFTPTQIENNIARTNEMYGGWDPKSTNTYYTHGEVDPWRNMGIQKDYNPSSPATVIPIPASHCADLYSASSVDSPEMAASKQKVRQLFIQWLQD